MDGTDATGAKMYAGNYTWWAEANNYITNNTKIIYLYGGLNLSFRYNNSLQIRLIILQIEQTSMQYCTALP